MIEVVLGENDRLDWALKQFRRKMIRSGLLKDLKKRRFYEKPSEAKKRKAGRPSQRRPRSPQSHAPGNLKFSSATTRPGPQRPGFFVPSTSRISH